ncbi:MAG: hypothetical protein KGI60_00460 [Patescibacteria group bacterium]|nr:hypothetical protein [Patescibacteria group bacterium]
MWSAILALLTTVAITMLATLYINEGEVFLGVLYAAFAVTVGCSALTIARRAGAGHPDTDLLPPGIYSVLSSVKTKNGYAVVTRMDSGNGSVHMYLLKTDPPKHLKSTEYGLIRPYP